MLFMPFLYTVVFLLNLCLISQDTFNHAIDLKTLMLDPLSSVLFISGFNYLGLPGRRNDTGFTEHYSLVDDVPARLLDLHGLEDLETTASTDVYALFSARVAFFAIIATLSAVSVLLAIALILNIPAGARCALLEEILYVIELPLDPVEPPPQVRYHGDIDADGFILVLRKHRRPKAAPVSQAPISNTSHNLPYCHLCELEKKKALKASNAKRTRGLKTRLVEETESTAVDKIKLSTLPLRDPTMSYAEILKQPPSLRLRVFPPVPTPCVECEDTVPAPRVDCEAVSGPAHIRASVIARIRESTVIRAQKVEAALLPEKKCHKRGGGRKRLIMATRAKIREAGMKFTYHAGLPKGVPHESAIVGHPRHLSRPTDPRKPGCQRLPYRPPYCHGLGRPHWIDIMKIAKFKPA